MAQTISVVAGPRVGPGQVALWERHADHPDGEVYVAAPSGGEDAQGVRVARTAEVLTRLGDGRLAEVGRRRAADDEDEEAPAAEGQAPARPAGRRAGGGPAEG